MNPRDAHLVMKLDLARTDLARDRRCRRRLGCGREWYMPLAGKESRRWIEADPSRARKINLGPRMQIGEVLRRTDRTIERFHIGLELDEISRDEARREADVAQNLDQQPCGVAAGSFFQGQRLFARLDAGFEPDDVPDRVLKLLIQRDQEIDASLGRKIDFLQVRTQLGPWRLYEEKRRQFLSKIIVILERPVLVLQEKIERIDHRYFGNQIHFD